MRQTRYLIVNADDLGLSDGVTEGIVRAWREGVVTSTSAMINVEGAAERVAATRAAHPDLPIGLHLNITTGRPVLPPERVPSLVDASGRFFTSAALLDRLPQISLDELRAELRAQAELLLGVGVTFDHVDYHEGMLMFYPPFYRVVRELAKGYGVPVRQPTPASLHGHVKLPRGGGATALRAMVRFALRHPIAAARLMPHVTPSALKRRGASLAAEGLRAPDWFIDSYFGNATVDAFVAMLRQLPPGVSEVAVHPGIVDDQLRTLGGDSVEEREAELAVLLDPRVREALATHEVTLADFSLLTAPRR
jgi:predicted glycoside hydrolase/deacetylase ChbG (UPF0249 family)